MYRASRNRQEWTPHGRNGIYRWDKRRGSTHIIVPASNQNIDEYWCETCDRGFPSKDMLDRHNQQHQKCNIDGCQFIAHPKVITKHIQMQHSSGLFKKISKLNNPEEIQKWREERKKKYPTRINIEKKAAEHKEKVERGEKMALKRVKNCDNRNSSDSQKSDKFTNRKRTHSFDKNKRSYGTNNRFNQRQNDSSSIKDHTVTKKMPKSIPNVPSIIEKNKLIPFTGIMHMVMHGSDGEVVDKLNNTNSLIEDDDYEVPMKVIKPTQEPVICGALASLMGCYESSEDEANEKENEVSNVLKTGNISDPSVCDTRVTQCEIASSRNIEGNEQMNTTHNEENMPHIVEQKDNIENSDDDSGPEEVKSIKPPSIESPEIASYDEERKAKINKIVKTAKQLGKPRNAQRQNNNYRHKIPSTLLQKLLHKEIRHERNIVLQCIRHIRMMNYFDNSKQ